jgi:hypothetical protein
MPVSVPLRRQRTPLVIVPPEIEDGTGVLRLRLERIGSSQIRILSGDRVVCVFLWWGLLPVLDETGGESCDWVPQRHRNVIPAESTEITIARS